MAFEDIVKGIVKRGKEKIEKEVDMRKNYYSQSCENSLTTFLIREQEANSYHLK